MSDGPQPIITALARGPKTSRQLREAGCQRVGHWMSRLHGDGAVVRDERTGRWRLTWDPMVR